jgi:hypothetical protein
MVVVALFLKRGESLFHEYKYLGWHKQDVTFKKLLPPTTNTCLYMDVSRHYNMSRYIHIETDISGRREYKICNSNKWFILCLVIVLLCVSTHTNKDNDGLLAILRFWDLWA